MPATSNFSMLTLATMPYSTSGTLGGNKMPSEPPEVTRP